MFARQHSTDKNQKETDKLFSNAEFFTLLFHSVETRTSEDIDDCLLLQANRDKKSGFVVKLLMWKKKQQKEQPFYGKTEAEVFSHMEKAKKIKCFLQFLSQKTSSFAFKRMFSKKNGFSVILFPLSDAMFHLLHRWR